MANRPVIKNLPPVFKNTSNKLKGMRKRLEKILSSHEETFRGAKCKGMEGIVAERADS